jgi:hypothetical protein
MSLAAAAHTSALRDENRRTKKSVESISDFVALAIQQTSFYGKDRQA